MSTRQTNCSEKLSHKRPAKVDRFWIGATYYPEHWDEKTRAKDPELMVDAGFNIVRMAEFAWTMMEPQEGNFDFSFFDSEIERLGRHGIRTMLCTPTAAPPVWLTRMHPEMLRVNENGVRMSHGSRQHACPSNPLFRAFSKKISSAMAEHFSGNSNVVGWQTDNEFNCHFNECHCEACQNAFRDFLRAKYAGDIAELNRRWGNVFWSLSYSDFAEIETPHQMKPAYVNPSHQLDYYRFINHSITAFQHDQVEILRRAGGKKWFITHNGCFNHIDYRGDFSKDLDFLGYDVYPMFNNRPDWRASSQAFALDMTRALAGNFMVPEHQSGPGGQPPYFHNNPLPGEARAMTWKSISRGVDSLLYFRWRTCRFGAEEYWCGIIDHDNVPRRRFKEISSVGNEIKKLGSKILGTSVSIDCAVAGGDMEAQDADSTYLLGLPTIFQAGANVHSVLLKRKFAVGAVHPEDDLSGLKLYFIPHWSFFKKEWVKKLESFVENGGTLVIGARSGSRNEDNHVVADLLPGCLKELAGVSVVEYGKLNPDSGVRLELDFGGSSATAEHWYEALELEKGSRPYAVWRGLRHLDGQCAISLRNLGKGKVFYVGTYFTYNFADLFLPGISSEAGLEPVLGGIPEPIEVTVRKDSKRKLYFIVNNINEDCVLPSAPAGTDLLTGKKIAEGQSLKLEPFGCALVESTAS